MFKLNTNQQYTPSQQIKEQQRQPKTSPITDDYEITNTVLGLGINGKVVQCTNRKNGKKYALKRSTKSDKLLGFSATFFRPDKSYIINIRLLAFIKDGICVMKPPYEMVDDIKIGNDKLTELRKIYPNI